MHDYYVASRWRNKDQVELVVNGLRAKGKTVYSFLENKHSLMEVTDDPEETMKKHENTKDWWHNKNMKHMFEEDMDGIRFAKNVVLLLPAGKSSHIEAGVAYGMGKQTILIGEQKEAESLYFIFKEHYNTIEDFLSSL